MSKILSIAATVHDSGIAYLVDGKIICAFEEEKFKRLKGIFNQFSFPDLCLEALEEKFGVSPFDDDVIVVMPKPVVCGLDYIRRILEKKDIYLYDHHLSHAATAYFLSGFESETTILTLDAGDLNGIKEEVLNSVILEKIISQNLPTRKTEIPEKDYIECLTKAKTNDRNLPNQLWMPENSYVGSQQCFLDSSCFSFHIARNGRIEESTNYKGYYSLAAFWDYYCGINGLFGGKDEGKIVGLAAQGKFNSGIYDNVGRFFEFDGDPRWKNFDSVKNYFDSLDLIEDLELRKDGAFMVQMLSEQYILGLVDWIKQKNPSSRNLSLAGGLFSNVKINQRINEYSQFEEIFIAPGMGDGGLALGAALSKANELGEFFPQKVENVFWGMPTDLGKSPADLISNKYSPQVVAQILSEGRVVGVFSNRREWGPRALGATSILYDPSDKNSQSYINSRLNRNEEMPFAPIVLDGYESELFHCYKSKYASKFMTICYDVKEQWVEKIPGVINTYDKTSRIQIVDYLNEPFYSILEEFFQITSIPVLMNTSFNVHGEPIINDVEDAFKHLLNGVVDYLVVGDIVYENPEITLKTIFAI